VGGSSEFISNGARLLEPRAAYFYAGTGISPTMAVKIVGGGSQYALAAEDAERNYLDGGKNCRLHMPPKVGAPAMGSPAGPIHTGWN
jgi:hypothetical protein